MTRVVVVARRHRVRMEAARIFSLVIGCKHVHWRRVEWRWRMLEVSWSGRMFAWYEVVLVLLNSIVVVVLGAWMEMAGSTLVFV